MDLICSFDKTKNQHYFYRGKDCVENFCKILKELGTEIVIYEEKEMIRLTDEEIKSYREQRMGGFCFNKNKKKNLNFIIKTEIIVITPKNLEELLILIAI